MALLEELLPSKITPHLRPEEVANEVSPRKMAT